MDDERLLVLDGTKRERRILVLVGEDERLIGGEMFSWLVRIAIARMLNKDGKIALAELDGGSGAGPLYLMRLRQATTLKLTMDGFGNVRLDHEARRIFFCHKRIAEFCDARIDGYIAGHTEELREYQEAI